MWPSSHRFFCSEVQKRSKGASYQWLSGLWWIVELGWLEGIDLIIFECHCKFNLSRYIESTVDKWIDVCEWIEAVKKSKIDWVEDTTRIK